MIISSITVNEIISNRNMTPKRYSRSFPFSKPVKKNKIDVAESSRKSPATFQVSLRTTLIIGQLFSLLPVEGVYGKKASNVKFIWWSWKCVYLLFSLLGQTFITVMCIHKVFHTKSSLNGTTPVIFYGTTCITMLMFLKVAKLWPELVNHIVNLEDQEPYVDNNLTCKCNTTCAVVLVLALVEHLLSLLSAFAGGIICQDHDFTHQNFVKHFYPWIFNYLPYSVVLGVITQFLHFQSTFIWNFSDLFIICMSYYLISRLDHVNKNLLSVQGKYLPETFWRTAREEYSRAVQLIRKVDNVINGVTFISFANNLFFICLQLFNTLQDGIRGHGECTRSVKWKTSILGGNEAAAYFLFSLIYLISRSVAVSLIAAQVNSASNVPAIVLYDVPSPVYSIEVQRFLDQVNGDTVALSGLQFFNITRGLLLTIAGTIVTYELVMFQFNIQPQNMDVFSTTMSPTYNTTS